MNFDTNTLVLNKSEYLIEFFSIRFIEIDLYNKNCTKTIISPILNSTAEKIKKKNVNDNILMLSNRNPTKIETLYKDIHTISAVNKRERDVELLIMNENSIIKMDIINKFKSPIKICFIKFINNYSFKLFILNLLVKFFLININLSSEYDALTA